MCRGYSKLSTNKEDLDSPTDDNTTDNTVCRREKRSRRISALIKKAANKVGDFMLNCIQSSGDNYFEYMAPDPSTYYALVGLYY